MKAQKKISAFAVIAVMVLTLMISVLAGGCGKNIEPEPTPTPIPLEKGYVSTLNLEASYCDELGTVLGKFLRGTQVEYEITRKAGNPSG